MRHLMNDYVKQLQRCDSFIALTFNCSGHFIGVVASSEFTFIKLSWSFIKCYFGRCWFGSWKLQFSSRCPNIILCFCAFQSLFNKAIFLPYTCFVGWLDSRFTTALKYKKTKMAQARRRKTWQAFAVETFWQFNQLWQKFKTFWLISFFPIAKVLKPESFFYIKRFVLSGSPGLVVMGGDSCSKGCEFKSQHRILDGHFNI